MTDGPDPVLTPEEHAAVRYFLAAMPDPRLPDGAQRRIRLAVALDRHNPAPGPFAAPRAGAPRDPHRPRLPR